MNRNDELKRWFTAYIHRVIVCARTDYLRKLSYKEMEFPLDDDDLAQIADKETDFFTWSQQPDAFHFREERIGELFARLPAHRQHILVLAFIEDMTSSEIARLLGRTPDYIYRQKSLALTQLRALLQCERGGKNGK